MYVEYFDNRTGKLLGTIIEHKGRLFTDSDDPFLLDEVRHFSQPQFTPMHYFGKVSRRFETFTSCKVFDDNNRQIVILENGDIVFVEKPAAAADSTSSDSAGEESPENVLEGMVLPDVSAMDDVEYVRIAYIDIDKGRRGAVEYRNGTLTALDAWAEDHIADRMSGTPEELVEFRKKYLVMIDMEERASYLSTVIEEVMYKNGEENG